MIVCIRLTVPQAELLVECLDLRVDDLRKAGGNEQLEKAIGEVLEVVFESPIEENGGSK